MTITRTSGSPAPTLGDTSVSGQRRVALIPMILVVASLVYALAGVNFVSHLAPSAECMTVFIAGAAPGLLVILTLWIARPVNFGRSLRLALVAAVLSGAAFVSLLPLLAERL
jgi:hypothetical protein